MKAAGCQRTRERSRQLTSSDDPAVSTFRVCNVISHILDYELFGQWGIGRQSNRI